MSGLNIIKSCIECKHNESDHVGEPCNDCYGDKWEYNGGYMETAAKFTPIPTMKDRRDPVTECIRAGETGKPSQGCTMMEAIDAAIDVEVKETYDRCNTGLDQKRDNYDTFSKLIANQFLHGGQKYALKGDKEFTDAICEAFPGETGVDWVLGTCMKYLGRYKNFGREKDLLKVATYMYLLWLKGGFHLKDTHDEDTNKDGGKTNG